jgi:nucleoside-diphosphate-sugar epimerase
VKVLVAGATGVLGRAVVPVLQEAGHEVTGLAGSPRRLDDVPTRVVVADLLDRAATASALDRAAPDAVVHLGTAIPARPEPRRFERQMDTTNRLRREGTFNLVEAAGSARLVLQGTALYYRPGSSTPAHEQRPFWTDGPTPLRPAVRAMLDAERQVRLAGGAVLRFGHLYGPGTHLGSGGRLTELVRSGRFPIVGDGGSVFSFIHVDDAASAVRAALETGASGAYNIVDDEPAPVRDWLVHLARTLGAPAPRRVPVGIARLLTGRWSVATLTSLTGASNDLARSDLGWEPSRPTWRVGFAELAAEPSVPAPTQPIEDRRRSA